MRKVRRRRIRNSVRHQWEVGLEVNAGGNHNLMMAVKSIGTWQSSDIGETE